MDACFASAESYHEQDGSEIRRFAESNFYGIEPITERGCVRMTEHPLGGHHG